MPNQPPNSPAVSTYSFNGMDLRVVEIAGEPWFVSSDALTAMGYALTGHATIRKKLSPDEVRIKRIYTNGKSRENSIISESGLYKLTMRSDKKEAKQFQEWVTREVLPSIRKTGSYTMPGARKRLTHPVGQHSPALPLPDHHHHHRHRRGERPPTTDTDYRRGCSAQHRGERPPPSCWRGEINM